MAEVQITRVFEAPREKVFKAWTDPDEVAQWYGPDGFDVPREQIKIDARVGGRWEVTMVRRGDGSEMPIGYEIIELVEPELLLMRSDPMAGMPQPTLVRVEFQEDGRNTRVTLTDGPLPEAGAGPAEAGYQTALERLATRLARI